MKRSRPRYTLAEVGGWLYVVLGIYLRARMWMFEQESPAIVAAI